MHAFRANADHTNTLEMKANILIVFVMRVGMDWTVLQIQGITMQVLRARMAKRHV